MRRGLIVLLAVGLVIVGVLGLRGVIAPEAVRARLEATLAAWIGEPVRVEGTAEVDLLPTPRMRWRRAELTAVSGSRRLVAADEIEAPIALLPLLAGRVEPTGLALRGIAIDLDRNALLATAALAARADDLPPLALTIERGTVEFVGPDGRRERLEAVAGTFDRSGPTAGLDLRLTGRWRDEPVTLDAALPLGSTATKGRLVASLAGASVKAQGKRRLDPAGFDGTAVVAVPEPARLARLADLGPLADLLRAPIALETSLAADRTAVTLSELSLSLGESEASGSLAVTFAGREPALSGTLAFGDLDLGGAPPIFGDGWKAVSLDAAHLGLALDLRLSAKRLVTPRFELTRPAASLNLAAGRLDAEIADAGLWGRPVSLVITGDVGDGGLSARLRALAKDLPATEIGRLFAIDGVEGGTVAAAFEGTAVCADLGACADAVSGRLRLSTRDLAVTGTSPFGDVTRFHPIVVASKPTSRRTLWSSAEADVHVEGTAARFDAVEMTGADGRFALRGEGSFADGTVDLSGLAYFRNLRAAPASAGDQEIRIPLRVHGSIRRLEITPAMPEQVTTEPPAPTLAPIPIVPPIAVPTR